MLRRGGGSGGAREKRIALVLFVAIIVSIKYNHQSSSLLPGLVGTRGKHTQLRIPSNNTQQPAHLDILRIRRYALTP